MGNQKDNNDELLFGLLSEKLYNHYCGTEEEHLGAEEEQAVLNMLNSLQVEDTDDFDPTNSFKKFSEKYLEDGTNTAKEKKINSIDELLERMENDIRTMQTEKKASLADKIFKTFHHTKLVRRVAFGVLVVAVMFGGMNIGTYATAKMGFFEFLSKSKDGWSFMVTGERETAESVAMDNMDKKVFSSWEEVKALDGMGDMMIPEWIPEGVELEKIEFAQGDDKKSFKGKYCTGEEEKIYFAIEKYEKDVRWQYFMQALEAGFWEKEVPGVSTLWYMEDDKVSAFFTQEEYGYYVYGEISEDEMIKIIENIK